MRVLLFLLVVANALATDPDIDRDVPALIASKGYRAEQYEVITEDGYKLTVHRIPCRRSETNTAACDNKRPTVFLQHGLLCSSSNWLTNLANESLGYLLADAGFDVFLGNVRGNQYSRAHVSLSPAQSAFWKFSYDEFAKFDLPAMIDTALKVSGNEQLHYIGHSQGTMIGFIQFSEDQQLAKKIKHFYALGPVATVKHIKGPLKIIGDWTKTLSFALWALGVNEFLPNSWVFNTLAKTVCADDLTNPLCSNILFIIAGYDSNQMNDTRIPVYVAHSPSGTSTQDVIHFGQGVESGKFAKYDYGWIENKKKYGQFSPPTYDVSKMQVPVTLYWGDEDWLADPTDIEENLLPYLQNIHGNFKLKQTNHLDLIWGMRVVETAYKPILAQIKAAEGMK